MKPIVPVGLKEMEAWTDYEIRYLDYEKQG